MILEVGKDVAGTDKDSVVSAVVTGGEKEQSKGEPGSSACVTSASPGEGCRCGLSIGIMQKQRNGRERHLGESQERATHRARGDHCHQ